MPTRRRGSGSRRKSSSGFSRSGSATADLLMSWASQAIEEKNYPLALDMLDQIVLVKPDFAEAWNKRATVYFLIDDYAALARRYPADAGA